MPANIDPSFSRAGALGFKRITSANVANTTKTLASGEVQLLLTADATNGTWLRSVQIIQTATNAATVLRFFINNGSATTTAANNTMIREHQLMATIDRDNGDGNDTEIPFNIMLPPSYRLYMTFTQAQNGGMHVTTIGGTL